MSRWPLLFTFQQKVYGNGFLANVVAHGSVLASQEEEGVWMDGVQPADLSVGGEDIYDAYLNPGGYCGRPRRLQRVQGSGPQVLRTKG